MSTSDSVTSNMVLIKHVWQEHMHLTQNVEMCIVMRCELITNWHYFTLPEKAYTYEQVCCKYSNFETGVDLSLNTDGDRIYFSVMSQPTLKLSQSSSRHHSSQLFWDSQVTGFAQGLSKPSPPVKRNIHSWVSNWFLFFKMFTVSSNENSSLSWHSVSNNYIQW